MPKKLTVEQVEQYCRDGYVSPVRAFPVQEALAYRARLEEGERKFGPLSVGQSGSKTHMLFTWADEMIRTPALLDAIEDLIGPDILVYQLTMWIKPPRDDAIVDWHQDASYFGLEPHEHVTAWVALTNANSEAGCVKVIPGSHKGGQLHHAVRQGRARNMLPRGQSIAPDYDASTAVEMPLQPGEFSLHHTLAVHGSEPNRSATFPRACASPGACGCRRSSCAESTASIISIRSRALARIATRRPARRMRDYCAHTSHRSRNWRSAMPRFRRRVDA